MSNSKISTHFGYDQRQVTDVYALWNRLNRIMLGEDGSEDLRRGLSNAGYGPGEHEKFERTIKGLALMPRAEFQEVLVTMENVFENHLQGLNVQAAAKKTEHEIFSRKVKPLRPQGKMKNVQNIDLERIFNDGVKTIGIFNQEIKDNIFLVRKIRGLMEFDRRSKIIPFPTKNTDHHI